MEGAAPQTAGPLLDALQAALASSCTEVDCQGFLDPHSLLGTPESE